MTTSAVPGDHHTTTADLAAVRERRAAYLRSHGHMGAFACCSAHASADDVPDLIAEVERLRATLLERMDFWAEVATDNERLRSELASARAATDAHVTRALDYLAGLDTTRMSTDAVSLGLDIVAILDGPGDPAPAACTCGAAPVHQHGCPAGQ